ncbi:MFS transporter [Paenibacillus hamazuiensis]|uniref:MFS transporter n=1 Tax=Paenibacillus hamazuiensis TaxID=2936508 RepID=UPI00200CCED6|nr:aromatic acid/H+ symport family MFS transporter [Paenibacillus hamazuiensis]
MKVINLQQIIDASKLNRFHLSLLLCCIFIIVCDGYDMFMLGAIIPALMKEWHITPIEAGALSSYALVGMMFGALIFGPVADRIGRKNVILLCTVVFSVFTFTSGFAGGAASFGAQRFIAGLGLGGVMPNLIALVTEYSPAKYRSTLVSVMFSGHALGGVVASLLAIYLMPGFGWRSVVWLSAVPLVLIPVLFKALPESLRFYVLKNQTDKVLSILNRLQRDHVYGPGDRLEHTFAEKNAGFPVKELFRENRAFSTVLFWISFFMCLLVMYGLSTWLPKLMQGAGYELGSSLTFLITLNAGAVIGAIGGGKLADRFGARKVLVIFFFIAFLSLLLLSFKPGMLLLYVLLAVAGGTTTGSQIIANSYVSQFYPAEMRSTGIGWALGIGRLGGIMGPTLGGVLLSLNLPLQMNFLSFAVPCVISALAILLVQEKFGQHARRFGPAARSDLHMS